RSLDFIQPLLTPHTLLIFLQNGISHLRYNNAEQLPATPVFATSSEGATRLGAGHIRHAGSGHTYLGFLRPQDNGATTKLEQLLPILQNSGLASSLSNDIQANLWAKLFVNVGINGLTAIHNLKNGQLLHSSEMRDRLSRLVQETEQVARAAGIAIHDDPIQLTFEVCRRTAQNISSMLQDVRNHRPTEIAAINGAVSQIGKELQIPTPENDALIARVLEIEANYPN
ncbi:MAG: 2-dehydropantoate 2-reductase, partial [Thermodesulfobacteriota bacterium]